MSSKNQELYYKPQNFYWIKNKFKKNKQIKIGIVKNYFGSTIYFICIF